MNERLNPLNGTSLWPWNQQYLDNWDFLRLVNQRGVSGKITATGYFIDRWRLTSGSVEITSNGLVLNGTMVQILETDPGGPVTATVLTADGPKAAQYSASTKTFTVSGTGETLIAAKLEPGLVQTLAHKEGDVWVPNRRTRYEDELARCRRYYKQYATGTGIVFYPHTLMIPVDISDMRITPTVKLSGIVRPGGKSVTISSVSIVNRTIVAALSTADAITTLGTGLYYSGLILTAEL